MGTCNGGHISTFGSSCGRLVEGGFADLVVLDPKRIASPFLHASVDPLEAIMYRARSADISTVVAAGRVLLDAGRLVGIDEESLVRRLAEVAAAGVPESARAAMRVRAALEPYVRAFRPVRPADAGEPSYHVNSLAQPEEEERP